MGFAKFHVGHAHPNKHTKHNKNVSPPKARLLAPRDDGPTPSASFSPKPSCFTGGFYTSPSNGASIPALTPLAITWDPSCLDTTHADIYLFSPGSTASRIYVWQRVPFAPGTYTAQLMPRWWNATSAQSLQLSIVASGTPPFLTELPAGPVFTATYSPPTDGTAPPPEADITQSDTGTTFVEPVEASGQQKSLASGRTAAAVLVPLLFLALAVAAYLKWQRGRAQKETKRFSVAVDKRMSTISGDWKSMTPAGASAAIRSSMAAGRDSAAFAFGGVRPQSVLGAGTGVGAYVTEDGQMSQVRTGTGVGLRSPKPPGSSTERVSRVSFAADTRMSRVSFADTVGRPSGESRRTRAFHSAYIPPLPTRDDSNPAHANNGGDWEKRRTEVMSVASAYPDSLLPVENGEYVREEGTLSPRQAQGPLTLTPDDIRARIQNGQGRRSDESDRSEGKDEMDAVMPALSMMRTNQTDEYLFTPMPTPPTPTHPKPTSSHYTPASPAPTYTTLAPGAAPPTPTYGLSPSPSSPFATSPGAYGPGLVSPMTPAAGGVFGQQQVQAPVAAMSPDDMMKAYAERKAAAAAMGRSPSAMSMSGSSVIAGSGPGLGAMEVAPSPSHSHAPPSAFTPRKEKGRKLSLRAGLAGVVGRRGTEKEKEGKKMMISAPVQIDPASASTPAPVQGGPVETPLYASFATGGQTQTASVYSTGPGMAGVGARSNVGAGGMAGVGMAGVGVGMGAGAAYAIGEDEDEENDYESAYLGTAN